MAHLYVESPDGTHRVELVADEYGLWDAYCDRHRFFALYDRNCFALKDAYEEAAQHVDQH